MKKKIKTLLDKKEARKTELGKKAGETSDVAELRGINTELEGLNAEIAELRGMLDAVEESKEPVQREKQDQDGQEPEQRGRPQVGAARIIGTYGASSGQQAAERIPDRFNTPEYRMAFMDYVLEGKKTEGLGFRSDDSTTTGDISAFIRTTIINTVIEKMKDYGNIFSRVTISNVKAGIKLPVSSVTPTAAWIAEGLVADKQKKTINASVVFAYYKLQIRVALTLESDLVSLPIFEKTVSDNISQAMVIGLESAIISGSGTGQPLGMANDTGIPAAQVIRLTADEMGLYQTWTGLIAKLPRRYRNRAVIIINDLD